MTYIGEASALYLDGPVDRVYAGSTMVWPPGYVGAVLRDGPIGYWRLNEPSGGIARDISGFGNHASHFSPFPPLQRRVGPIGVNALQWRPGLQGEEGVSLPNSFVFPALSPITVEYWRISSPNTQIGWQLGGATTAFLRCMAHDVWTDGVLYWDFGDDPYFRASIANPTADGVNWWHCCLTGSSNNSSIYVNGSLLHSASRFMLYPMTRQLNGGTIGWTALGAFAEFAVYNKVLSAQQIAAHYAARLEPVQLP